jgi:hypothetical protein
LLKEAAENDEALLSLLKEKPGLTQAKISMTLTDL